MRKLLFIAAIAGMALAGCSKNEEYGNGNGSIGGNPATSVVKAEYITPSIIVIFNPLRANYTIQWTAVPGAVSYNVYKSTTSGGDTRTRVSTEGFTGTSITATELMTTGGTYVRYYWVTAVTGAGETAKETPRPANGGIKVTYKVTIQQTTMIVGPPPFYNISYLPIGPPTSITRTIEQNPIR